jgi:hypothetical protein
MAEPAASPAPEVDPSLIPPAPIVGGDAPVEEADPNKPAEDGNPPADGEGKDPAGEGQGEPKDKDGEGKEDKPEPKAPAEYTDFTIPEGVAVDPEAMTEFKGISKELDLTQDQAQKLMDFGSQRIKALAEAPYKLWADTQVQWQKDVKADPELGGANYEKTCQALGQIFVPGEGNPFVKTLDEAGALKQALIVTGAGNHPEIVRLCYRISTLLKEPTSISGAPIKDKGTAILDSLYPSMTENKA